jgi:DNA-binding MarR family transcriptional regulator
MPFGNSPGGAVVVLDYVARDVDDVPTILNSLGCSMTGTTRPRISKKQYETLANFRYELRRFLRYSEQVSRKNGVTPLQYQLLLHIKGYPGRDSASVTELAERLQAKHHGVVALITRCESVGLVKRQVDEGDRRRVFVALTEKGEKRLEKLAELHRTELLAMREKFLIPTFEEL